MSWRDCFHAFKKNKLTVLTLVIPPDIYVESGNDLFKSKEIPIKNLKEKAIRLKKVIF